MPEQAAQEAQAENIMSGALLESQIRNIRLRGIVSRLRDEIDELKGSWLTPKHAQKASMLKSALTLVDGVEQDGAKEQKHFEREIKEGNDQL